MWVSVLLVALQGSKGGWRGCQHVINERQKKTAVPQVRVGTEGGHGAATPAGLSWRGGREGGRKRIEKQILGLKHAILSGMKREVPASLFPARPVAET